VGPRTQDLDPELTPQPARCRAAVLTAPGTVPHASNRTQLSMTKDPKINNWIHNSPITGFKTHLQSQPAPACRRRGSQSCPLAVPTQDEPVPPGMGGRVRIVCRRCCTRRVAPAEQRHWGFGLRGDPRGELAGRPPWRRSGSAGDHGRLRPVRAARRTRRNCPRPAEDGRDERLARWTCGRPWCRGWC
jgi:hypothetical protein